MSDTRFPRGSEWRKWDLHVHTPLSAFNNQFGTDFEEYAKRLYDKAILNGIACIGVTDYFSIDGYKRLRKLIDEPGRLEQLLGDERGGLARQILLLPNVELRTFPIVRHSDEPDSRTNFHVIFSEDLDPELIDEFFFRNLKFTARARSGGRDDEWPLTLESLRALGRMLKEQHEPFRTYSDVVVGMMNAVVAHERVTETLEEQSSRFDGKYLIVLPADEDLSEIDWNGQGHLSRKILTQRAHMFFSSNKGTREFGLGKRHPSEQRFRDEFGSPKPCVHGSDSHSYDTLFEPAEGRQLWIKADPTFQGLRQLLHEPQTRVHIGPEPDFLAQTRDNATKYLSDLEFARTPHARDEQLWFAGSVPLNHGLIAIIGNKGSGKSALADILALLGDTRSSAYFSFLTQERFLNAKTMLAAMFRATVVWQSGRAISRVLNEAVDRNGPELVKYIPQHYLESICSELKEAQDTQFDRELTDVIFSHVDEPSRLGKETLAELVDYLANEQEGFIGQLLAILAEVNDRIVDLEYQQTEEHRKSIGAQLKQRRLELKAHQDTRPAEIKEPGLDAEGLQAAENVKRALEELVDQVQTIDKQIADAHQQLRTSALQVAAADRLLGRLTNLERLVGTFHNDSAGDASALGLDSKTLVTLSVDRQPIQQVKANAEALNQSVRTALAPDVAGSLTFERSEVSKKLESTRATLDEPNRIYQDYLHRLANWEKRRVEIEGSEEVPNSVKGLEMKLSALANIPAMINEQTESRWDVVREIVGAKLGLLKHYQKLYSPVQTFIDHHPISRAHGALQFSASIVVDGFTDGLLQMIHQGKRGSFQGEPEGREILRDLLKRSDFSNEAGIRAFVEEVQGYLDHDQRTGNPAKVHLREQLLQGKSPADVYNFLYGLGYLRPRFELGWQNKSLDQLSPGERGTLLLMFYLLIDKRDVPLIIDQPEENLDNQTIATMLVPAIKYAKERRQIIIVTHNPNLAVVCDAEQVIHSHLDKANGYRVTYTTGAIEDPTIVQLIVDVLEGTKPAFDLRDAKYEVLERR